LVTGGGGVLGARLVDALAARGLVVRALVHRRPVPGAAEQVAGDVRDGAALAAALRDVHTVVHLAALTHARRPRAYLDVNATGTARVVEAAGDVARFVHASTRAIAPAGGGYSHSKALAEQAVSALADRAVVVRLPEVYGGDGSEGVDRVLAGLRAGSVVPVVADPRAEVRPLHIEEATAALVGATVGPAARARTYTLGSESRTLAAFAAEARELLGSDSRIVAVPVGLLGAACAAARVLPLPVYPDQLRRLLAAKPEPTPEAAAELGFAVRPLAERLRGQPGR
jgi:nucleoside-diphosphate-sugar epimerase